jgi:hypothetical protein
MMEVIKDPEENELKIATKSVLIGRMPRKDNDKFKTAIIRLFKVNNPHKTTEFPFKTFEFSNTEKIRIKRLNVSYYLEGNDLVINDLDEIFITREDTKLVIKGYQTDVEKRENHAE